MVFAVSSESGGALPFPLAYVWGDFESFAQQAAQDPRSGPLALYHLLDAVEVSTRFLLAVATAELDASGVVVKDPKNGWLGEHPAFGRWVQALEFTTKRLSDPVVVPRVGEAVVGLRALVDDGAFDHRDLKVKNLIGLRNWMAHGGVLTEAVAQEILQVARPAIDQFLEVCTSVFTGVGLAYVGDDGSAAAIELEDGSPPPVGLSAEGPGLYVGRDGQWLQIWPLVRHAPAGRGEEAGRRLVTQVFVRLSAVAEYATLDPDSVAAFGRAESRAYRERFTGARPFWEELEDEAEGLIGRAEELARLRACLEASRTETDASPWWLSGPMGQGKSALAAAAAVELRDSGDHLVVTHFFRSGDQRCNLRSFVVQALDALDPEGDHSSDPQKALARLKTLLHEQSPTVICDGVDELTRSPTAASKDLETLFQLSGSGGVWLFTGRSDLDAVAEEAGFQKVFDPALPPMTAADLRGLVVSLAPQAVRDAILLRDQQGQSGELDNPYVSQLAERAQGLPLYVVLMLDWLASMDRPAEVKAHIAAALEDPEGTIPTGLSSLYATLIEGWGGLGVKLTIKTPLLCLLAAAAEPLDAESLAQLCFQSPAQTDAEVTRRVTICEDALTAFSPVLWSAPDQDGVLGWRILHDSFRGYLADPDNAELRPVFDDARYILATRGAEPERVRHLPLTRHLYRHGIGYLRADGNQARADQLLSDFSYLYGRLEALGPSGVDPLLVDYDDCADPMCQEWAAFLRTHAHFLRRNLRNWGPERSLHQLAYDAPESSAVAAGAVLWSEHHEPPPLHLETRPAASASKVVTLSGHTKSVAGALKLNNGSILSWSVDTTLRTWDPDTGAPIRTFEGHTKAVTGALELRDGRIVSWSEETTLRIWDPGTGASLYCFEGHTNSVMGAVQLSNGSILSWSADTTLRAWDPDTSAPIATFEGHTKAVTAALELKDGRILSWSADSTVRRWDPSNAAELKPSMELYGHVIGGVVDIGDHQALSWSHGTASGNRDVLRVWDLTIGIQVDWPHQMKGHENTIKGALPLSKGRILSWSVDRTLRVWDRVTCNEVIKPMVGHSDAISGALLLSDNTALSCSWDHSLRKWDLTTGEELRPAMEGHTGSVRGILLKPDDENRALSWSDDCTLRLWDIDSHTEDGPPLIGHSKAVTGAIFISPDRVLSWSDDFTLRVWDVKAAEPADGLVEGHTGKVWGARMLPENRVLSWSEDGTLRLWDLIANRERVLVREPPRPGSGWAAGAMYLPGDRIVSWSKDAVRAWDLADPETTHELPLTGDSHELLALPRHQLLSWRRPMPGSEDGVLQVWDLVTGNQLGSLVGHTRSVNGALLVSEDRVLTWSEDCTLRAWNLVTQERLPPMADHASPVDAALLLSQDRVLSSAEDGMRVWDRDGNVLARMSPSKGIGSGLPLNRGILQLSDERVLSWSHEWMRVWDLSTGEIVSRLDRHTDAIKGVLALDRDRLLSWSKDSSLRLWNPETGEELVKMTRHTATVWGAVSLLDNRALSWSYDGTVRVWDLATGGQLAEQTLFGPMAFDIVERQVNKDQVWSAFHDDNSICVFDNQGELAARMFIDSSSVQVLLARPEGYVSIGPYRRPLTIVAEHVSPLPRASGSLQASG